MTDKWKVPQFHKLRQFFLSGAEPRRAGRLGKGTTLPDNNGSAEMPTAPTYSRIIRCILAWMFAPPLWKSECQASIDAFAADNKRVLAQMDEDIAAFKAAEAPLVERGKDAWLK